MERLHKILDAAYDVIEETGLHPDMVAMNEKMYNELASCFTVRNIVNPRIEPVFLMGTKVLIDNDLKDGCYEFYKSIKVINHNNLEVANYLINGKDSEQTQQGKDPVKHPDKFYEFLINKQNRINEVLNNNIPTFQRLKKEIEGRLLYRIIKEYSNIKEIK